MTFWPSTAGLGYIGVDVAEALMIAVASGEITDVSQTEAGRLHLYGRH